MPCNVGQGSEVKYRIVHGSVVYGILVQCS